MVVLLRKSYHIFLLLFIFLTYVEWGGRKRKKGRVGKREREREHEERWRDKEREKWEKKKNFLCFHVPPTF